MMLHDSSNVKAYKGAGICYLSMNDNNKAIVYFEKALQLEPDNKNTLHNLSVLYLNIGDSTKANFYKSKEASY